MKVSKGHSIHKWAAGRLGNSLHDFGLTMFEPIGFDCASRVWEMPHLGYSHSTQEGGLDTRLEWRDEMDRWEFGWLMRHASLAVCSGAWRFWR